MDGKQFVEHLNDKYYADLEGPVLALRKALAELDHATPEFVALMKRQAGREQRHGIAFTKALLQYPELGAFERAAVAEQAAEEFRHFAIIKDYLISRGDDVPDEPIDAYDAYFDRFLAGDVRVFRLCNIAEKSAVVFIEHLRHATSDDGVRRMASDILDDEEGHEELLDEKLAKFADDESQRDFLEAQFVESWSSQKTGVFAEARELGIDIDGVLARAGLAMGT